MKNNFRGSILVGAVVTVCVMGNCSLAQATPSQTGPNFSGIDNSVWTWPVGKAAPSKAANNGGKIGEVWTWPISKEARSLVWTEARSQVSNKSAQGKIASLKSVFLGGL